VIINRETARNSNENRLLSDFEALMLYGDKFRYINRFDKRIGFGIEIQASFDQTVYARCVLIYPCVPESELADYDGIVYRWEFNDKCHLADPSNGEYDHLENGREKNIKMIGDFVEHISEAIDINQYKWLH
jgi:hypothetical protein